MVLESFRGSYMLTGRRHRRFPWLTLAGGTVLLGGLALPLAMSLHGCDEGYARQQDENRRMLVAMIGAGEDDPLWPMLRAGAEAQRAGMPRIALRVEAPPHSSPSAQAEVVRRLAGEGLRGLCIQVTDQRALRDLLEQLRDRGVVVVTMGQPVESRVAFHHVGWSEQHVGEMLGRAAAEAFAAGGRIGLIKSAEDFGPLVDRYQAFKSEIAPFIGIEVFTELPCRSSAEAEALLRRGQTDFPGLSGWVSMGPWPLMIEKARAEELLRGRVLIAADPLPATWDVLDSDMQVTAVGPDYGELIRMALGTTRDILMQGGAGRDRGTVPIRTVGSANVAAFRDSCMPSALRAASR